MANPLVNIAGMLGDFIKSALGQFSIAWAQTNDWNKSWEEYETAVDEQISGVESGLQDRLREAMGMFNRGAQQQLHLLATGRDVSAAKIEQISNSIQDSYNDMLDRTLTASERTFAQEQGLYAQRTQDIVGGLEENAAEIERGFQERYDRNLAELRDLGNAERADINERFEQRGAVNRQELADRGLGTSTILSASDNAVERERGRELSSLSERLSRERISLDAMLSADLLGAQERLGGRAATFGAALSGDELMNMSRLNAARDAVQLAIRGDTVAAQERLATGGLDLWNQWQAGLAGAAGGINVNRVNTFLGASGDIYNWLGGVQHMPPQQPNFWQYGVNMADTPSGPSSTEIWGPAAIQAGGSVAGAGILAGAGGGVSAGTAVGAKMAVMMCIDASATVTTPAGERPLSEIQIGDLVEDLHGIPTRVIAKDCGLPHKQRYGDYVLITKNDRSLIATRDHVIDGKPAGDWPTAVPADPVVSGDLALDGGASYRTGGFVVKSVLTPAMMEAK
jgi:hypothetical protein